MSEEGGKNVLKVVIVGDGAIGKTFLLNRILADNDALVDKETKEKKEFDAHEGYKATTFDTKQLEGQTYEGQKYVVEFWDTAGQESMEALRTLSYPETDVFLIGFCVNSRISLENVETKWAPELKESGVADAKLVLGCFKCDMRDDQSLADSGDLISSNEGQEMAENIDARAYIECSAVTGKNVDMVLKLVTAIGASKKKEGKGGADFDEKFPLYEAGEGAAWTPEQVLGLVPKPGEEPEPAPPKPAPKPAPGPTKRTEDPVKEPTPDPPKRPKKKEEEAPPPDEGCKCVIA